MPEARTSLSVVTLPAPHPWPSVDLFRAGEISGSLWLREAGSETSGHQFVTQPPSSESEFMVQAGREGRVGASRIQVHVVTMTVVQQQRQDHQY